MPLTRENDSPLTRGLRRRFVSGYVMTRGLLGLLCLLLVGCGTKPAAKTDGSVKNESGKTEKNGVGGAEVPSPVRRKPAFGGNGNVAGGNENSKSTEPKTPNTPAAIRAKLKPFQVIVGKWSGTVQRGTSTGEQPVWRWDFTNPKQPALAFESQGSVYLKKGRITFLPGKEEYRLIGETKDGTLKTYSGKLTVPVADVPGDGKKLQRTFTLTFTQIDPKPKRREPLFQIAFQQMHNDRYLTIIHRKSGSRLQQTARIGNQRNGTSFAASLDDYGDKTCVVSQGLGTIPVSHDGKTYYVCCSGCRKAFEEDPKQWIASFEEWKKKNKK